MAVGWLSQTQRYWTWLWSKHFLSLRTVHLYFNTQQLREALQLTLQLSLLVFSLWSLLALFFLSLFFLLVLNDSGENEVANCRSHIPHELSHLPLTLCDWPWVLVSDLHELKGWEAALRVFLADLILEVEEGGLEDVDDVLTEFLDLRKTLGVSLEVEVIEEQSEDDHWVWALMSVLLLFVGRCRSNLDLVESKVKTIDLLSLCIGPSFSIWERVGAHGFLAVLEWFLMMLLFLIWKCENKILTFLSQTQPGVRYFLN